MTVYDGYYIPAPFPFAAFANSSQQNLLLLSPFVSSIMNCTFLADTPNQQRKHLKTSTNHSVILSFTGCNSFLGRKGWQRLRAKSSGRVRESWVCPVCFASGAPVMPLHFSRGWLSNKITFLFSALSFGWRTRSFGAALPKGRGWRGNFSAPRCIIHFSFSHCDPSRLCCRILIPNIFTFQRKRQNNR